MISLQLMWNGPYIGNEIRGLDEQLLEDRADAQEPDGRDE